MTLETLDEIAQWAAAILTLTAGALTLASTFAERKREARAGAILAFVACGITLISIWTGSVITTQKDAEIRALKPWALSENERKTLTDELRFLPTGKIVLKYHWFDGEGKDFASKLAETFRSAGWTPIIAAGSLNDLPDQVAVAISQINADKELPQTAARLCNSFTRAGIHCDADADIKPSSVGGALDPNTFYLVIGRKRHQIARY